MKGNMFFAAFIGCILLFGSVQSQQYERRWALGGGVNMLDYAAPQGSKLFQPNNWDMAYYVSLQRYLTAAFRLSADLSYAYGVRFPSYQGTDIRPALADMSYRLSFKFNNGTILGERALIAPYASVGIGGSYVRSHPDLYVPLGGGINIRMGQRTSLRLEMTWKQSLNQDFQHIAHTAYLVYDLGKQKRFSPDIKPFEEEEQAGPWIAMEAPDEDGDGVPDHYDRCPADPGNWKWQGCPGVPTSISEVPKVEATQPETSSPVEEAFFPEPPKKMSKDNIQALAKDAKPVVDAHSSVEELMNQPKQKASFLDDMRTSVDQNIQEKEALPEHTDNPCEPGKREAESVYFDLGSDKLSAEGHAYLDEVAHKLQQCNRIRLEVRGHADALGTERNNQLLSVLRANAVKRYLVYQHGISLSRIRCTGFGEQSPTANNNTEAGRRQNRRVDFSWQ
jgi:outer membrane protein OmpA-like peptidoglycan-associated protein